MIPVADRDNQVIEIAAGTHTENPRPLMENTLYRGAGVDKTIIRGANISGFLRDPVTPKERVTFSDLTFDFDNNPYVLGLDANSNMREIILNNVKIKNVNKNTIAVLNRSRFSATDFSINGDGTGVYHYLNCLSTEVRNWQHTGGKWGFLATGSGKFTIAQSKMVFDYFNNPGGERVIPTGITDAYVEVASHNVNHRNLYDVVRVLSTVGTTNCRQPRFSGAQRWDRLETSSGYWAWVESADYFGFITLSDWHYPGSWRVAPTPSGTATIYRITLGRLYGWTSSRLTITLPPTVTGHWRGTEGEIVSVPNPTYVDILRHGYTGEAVSYRDVDTGGVHILDGTGVLTEVEVRGGFSDCITGRSPGTIFHKCYAHRGQDMAFTVGPGQTLFDCTAELTGYNGFHLYGGPSVLTRCIAKRNGTHKDGNGGYGVVYDGPEPLTSVVDVTYIDNYTGNHN